MKKLCLILACSFCLSGCSSDKPPLTETQIVDGKSIVMPPEFYVLPKAQQESIEETQKSE